VGRYRRQQVIRMRGWAIARSFAYIMCGRHRPEQPG
jgi:hypothetical protein